MRKLLGLIFVFFFGGVVCFYKCHEKRWINSNIVVKKQFSVGVTLFFSLNAIDLYIVFKRDIYNMYL